jgi:hypothetical protein
MTWLDVQSKLNDTLFATAVHQVSSFMFEMMNSLQVDQPAGDEHGQVRQFEVQLMDIRLVHPFVDIQNYRFRNQ